MKHKLAHILLAVVFIASMAVAQNKMQPLSMGKPVDRPHMAGLNLTDEQQAKMDDLRLKHLKEVEPIQAEIQKQHTALKLEIVAEKFNESKVKNIQSEISKLQSDIAWKLVQHLRAVRDILTPEQQKKFDTGVLSGHGPGMERGMGRGMGMGPGMDHGMEQGMGMHHGMGMGPGGPANAGPQDQPKPDQPK